MGRFLAENLFENAHEKEEKQIFPKFVIFKFEYYYYKYIINICNAG